MEKILFVVLIVVGLLSCNKEEWFENIQPNVNFFAVPENATGEEAELRRNFYGETSIYLLFTDTLGTRETWALSGNAEINLLVLDFFL